jgi:hypothetical protein
MVGPALRRNPVSLPQLVGGDLQVEEVATLFGERRVVTSKPPSDWLGSELRRRLEPLDDLPYTVAFDEICEGFNFRYAGHLTAINRRFDADNWKRGVWLSALELRKSNKLTLRSQVLPDPGKRPTSWRPSMPLPVVQRAEACLDGWASRRDQLPYTAAFEKMYSELLVVSREYGYDLDRVEAWRLLCRRAKQTRLAPTEPLLFGPTTL